MAPEVNPIADANNPAFLAELKLRAGKSPEFLEQASAALAEATRPAVTAALSGAAEEAGAAAAPESPDAVILKRCRQEYDSLPEDAKKHLTWKAVSAKLMAGNGENLKKADAMQGGGHLFHITEKGEALFKDRGAEPVMYGWDKPEGEKGRQLVRIYGRVPDLMSAIKQWANAPEIEARVTADGYELFEDDGHYRFSEEMKRAAAANEGGLFVASRDNKQQWRDSVLKNARRAGFYPGYGHVDVNGADPVYRDDRRGAVCLLRV